MQLWTQSAKGTFLFPEFESLGVRATVSHFPKKKQNLYGKLGLCTLRVGGVSHNVEGEYSSAFRRYCWP
jgi:hypothetical protein